MGRTVSECFKFQEGAVSGEQRFWLEASTYKQPIVMITELRFWLEASTLSNRGEMRQHLPTD